MGMISCCLILFIELKRTSDKHPLSLLDLDGLVVSEPTRHKPELQKVQPRCRFATQLRTNGHLVVHGRTEDADPQTPHFHRIP